MIAGAGAGLVSSIVTCPLDVVKTQLQAQHSARTAKEYEGVQLTVVRIWRQSGFQGFYRGLGPTLGGYLPTWGIYFTVYDMVKDKLGRWVTGGELEIGVISRALTSRRSGWRDGAGPCRCGHDGWRNGNDIDKPAMGCQDAVHGESSNMTLVRWGTDPQAQAAWPPSSAKYKNTFQAFASIYRNEGYRAFYKGLLPSLMGVSHVAVQFPLYEKAKTWAGEP